MTKVKFNDYNEILTAETVDIHVLLNYFKKKVIDYDKYGNVFVNFSNETKGLPILVAHMDNVLNGTRTPVMDIASKRIFGKTAGIGFDDKAGIIAIIELWRRSENKDFRIIFTCDEEVGGIGASNIDPNTYNDAAYIIELDRRGDKDFIQTSGGTRLCSNEFAQLWLSLGFVKAQGTFTDVNIFKPQAKNVNMCNISIGYYDAHSDREYLDIRDFEKIVDKVQYFLEMNKEKIVDDTIDVEPEYKSNDRLSRWWNRQECCDWCANEINGTPIRTTHGVVCCQACKNALEHYVNDNNFYDDDDNYDGGFGV